MPEDLVLAVAGQTMLAAAEGGGHVPLKGPIALLIVIVAILFFHGSIYLVIALNTGWRFGYWLTGASMGGLAMFLSVFWLLGPGLGPRGEEPRWIAIGTAQENIPEGLYEGAAIPETGSYPGGDWAPAPENDEFLVGEQDAMKTAITSCLTADEETIEHMEGGEGPVCAAAQGFLPGEDAIPRVNDSAVPVQNDVRDIRFANSEGGVLIGQVTVAPIVTDPRVTGDPNAEAEQAVADPFVLALARNPGSIKLPSVYYFFGSLAFLLFHLWGLNRAEKRKISPVAV